MLTVSGAAPAGAAMRCVLLLPALLLLLALPATRGRYNDDFDDGEDLADFDDNDFAEFEDMSEDQAAEPETVPPSRVSAPADEDEEEDEDEATVELEDGGDGFDDTETQVSSLTMCGRVSMTCHAISFQSSGIWNIFRNIFRSQVATVSKTSFSPPHPIGSRHVQQVRPGGV